MRRPPGPHERAGPVAREEPVLQPEQRRVRRVEHHLRHLAAGEAGESAPTRGVRPPRSPSRGSAPAPPRLCRSWRATVALGARWTDTSCCVQLTVCPAARWRRWCATRHVPLSQGWRTVFARATGPARSCGGEGAVVPSSRARWAIRPPASRRGRATPTALQTRLDALEASPPDPWPELGVATATAVLPPTDLGASPPRLRRVLQNVLYDWLPNRARLTAIRARAGSLSSPYPTETVAR